MVFSFILPWFLPLPCHSASNVKSIFLSFHNPMTATLERPKTLLHGHHCFPVFWGAFCVCILPVGVCRRHPTHGEEECHRPEPAVRGDARLHVCDLLGQDRHTDHQPDVRVQAIHLQPDRHQPDKDHPVWDHRLHLCPWRRSVSRLFWVHRSLCFEWLYASRRRVVWWAIWVEAKVSGAWKHCVAKRGSLPCGILPRLDYPLFFVTWVSPRSHDCHEVGVNLAGFIFGVYHRI